MRFIRGDELVSHEGMQRGPVPSVIGFQFVGENQMREFSLLLKDGDVTANRDYGILFNRRDRDVP